MEAQATMKYKVAERSNSMRLLEERKVPFRAANTAASTRTHAMSPACWV